MDNWLSHALAEYDSTGFQDGQILTKDWLLFALEVPSAEAQTFTFFNKFEAFRKHLLLERKIALDNVWGHGYRIVPPNEQAEVAATTALNGIRRGLNRANVLMENTRLDQLTNEEKSRHLDTQVKLSGLKSLLNRQKKDILAMVTPAKLDN